MNIFIYFEILYHYTVKNTGNQNDEKYQQVSYAAILLFPKTLLTLKLHLWSIQEINNETAINPKIVLFNACIFTNQSCSINSLKPSKI